MMPAQKIIKKMMGALINRFNPSRKKKNSFSSVWQGEAPFFQEQRGVSKLLQKWEFLEKWEILEKWQALKKRAAYLKKSKAHLSRVERKRILRLRFGKAVLFMFFVVFGAFGMNKAIIYGLGNLEFFEIKNILVSGNDRVSRGEILLTGDINYGQSLIHISKEQLTEKITSEPWIRGVTIKKNWPSSLEIKIREQKIAALLSDGSPGEERLYYVSTKGEVIEAVKNNNDIDYPVITGYNILTDEQKRVALQESATFLKLIGKNNINLPAQSVSEIHFSQDEGMIVRLVEFPFPIIFGEGEVKKKYERLRDVLAILYKNRGKNLGMREVKSIHMDYLKDKVIVRRATSG